MPRPIPRKVTPNTGEPGDKFTVTVTGDVFTGVVKCDFGAGINVGAPKVINDGEVRVKITVTNQAKPGKRDVTLTNASGDSGPLSGGFEVL
jgi:predicted secreted protein